MFILPLPCGFRKTCNMINWVLSEKKNELQKKYLEMNKPTFMSKVVYL
jgi:hypothetical protein